jgi:hypothetical protein
VHERLHDADLLLVALGQPPDRPVEVEPEPLGSGPIRSAPAPPRRPREVAQQLAAVRRPGIASSPGR